MRPALGPGGRRYLLVVGLPDSRASSPEGPPARQFESLLSLTSQNPIALAWAVPPLLALAICACARDVEPRRPSRAEPAVVASNILREDYAGSKACRACHAEIYESFVGSAMHRMTRVADASAIRAPFDGRTLVVGGDRAVLFERDGARLMRLRTQRYGERLFRVTKVIGGRHREDFVGVDVTGAAHVATSRGQSVELVLPVSYVFATGELRYKGYSVMVPERSELHIGPKWAATCIGCHNTLPQLTMLYDDLLGGGEPYQGTITDDVLPSHRMFEVVAMDEHGLADAIEAELEVLDEDAPEPEGETLAQRLDHAIVTTRKELRDHHLIELGVGCEACHGGAREHAEDFRVLPSFAVQSPLLRARPADGRTASAAELANRACLRCHTVLFSGYPWTWEGGRRRGNEAGGSTTNSGEARDFLLGGCADAMTCTSCHDPHGVDHRARLEQLATPAGNATCVRCHEELAAPEAMAAHSHHAPDSAGNACVGCHMPKKNSSLEYRLTRYHRIGSPTDDARVLADRPIECALCHTRQSVESLVSTMEGWWGKRYDRRTLRRLYGDLEQPVLSATLERGKPHEQMAAIGVLGEQADADSAADLMPHLAHDYPLVRLFAKHAIERCTKRPVPVDIHAPATVIRAQLDQRSTTQQP
jgi:predicted CXXCH cytochrome family protein